MTAYLPPNLLALFAARDPVPYLIPIERPKHHRTIPYTGIAQYVSLFEDPSETPIPPKVETREEKRERRRKEKAEQIAYKVEQDLALWDPNNIENGTKDPYKTLFVARINYDTTESKLKREFQEYGPIKLIRVIKDNKSGKPRGYCFIEYEHERDMHAAYKHADGKKIDGRRVLVDVERSRTVRNWRPRRLGGGLGNTRRGPADQNSKYSMRDDPKDRDREKERDRSRRRSRSRERERKEVERPRERERERDRDKDKVKVRDKDREREKRERSKDKDKVRDREHKKKKSRSKERRKHRSRSKVRDRSKDKKRKKENGEVSAAIRQYGEYGAEME